MPQKSYWFRPGRLERQGRRNPGMNIIFSVIILNTNYYWFYLSGILSVDNKFEFTVHESSKDASYWSYSCKYRQTPKVKCPAKARVILFGDKWILQSADDNHTCEPNTARVTAELLKHRMKNIVRQDPVQACGKAVRKVRIEAAEEFGDDEDFYQHLVVEMGTDSSIEKQLLRVRAEIIGTTPRNRNDVHP